MTWSYSGNPASSDKDQVRFLLQDTATTRPLLQDEEIAWLLDQYETKYSSLIAVAAIGADVLAGRYASEVPISADGVSIGLDQLQTKYTTLAASLREQYATIAGTGVEPYAGGIERFECPDFSVREKDFGIGMHDNLRAGRQNYGEHGADYGDYLAGYDGGVARMVTPGFGLSDFTRQLVRDRTALAMVCQVMIARGNLGTLDPATGTVSGLTDTNVIYTGQARIYALSPGSTLNLGGGEILARDTTISIPMDAPVPYRDDLVTVIDGGPDYNLSTRIFRVLGDGGGGYFGDARRLPAQGWTQSRYWGEM